MLFCPFCGATGDSLTELWDRFDGGHIAHVHCMKCGCNGPSEYSEESAQDAVEKARRAWGSRRSPPKPKPRP